jgi:hypothetical protein
VEGRARSYRVGCNLHREVACVVVTALESRSYKNVVLVEADMHLKLYQSVRRLAKLKATV